MTERRQPAEPPARGGGAARLAWGLLVALGLALPFEAPLFPLGPLVITSSELLLYPALAAWGLSLLVGGAAPAALAARARAGLVSAARDPVARAVLLWLTVTALSAAVAPAGRTQALKFALRASSGG